MTWSPEECETIWPTDPFLPSVEYDEPEEIGRLYGPFGDLISIVTTRWAPFGFQGSDTP